MKCVEVKICGLTNLADALTACEHGADYLGFVLYPGSPRHIAPAALERLVGKLPPECRAVGVFVNESPGRVAEIAGDNGTYTRGAILDLLPAIARDGFWEPEIHRILKERGEHLWLDTNMQVTFAGSHSARAFSRQRFLHGRTYGRARAATRTVAFRLGRAALAPAVPALMLLRAVGTLRAKHRLDREAVASVPLAAWFFICWAAGEAVGLLSR